MAAKVKYVPAKGKLIGTKTVGGEVGYAASEDSPARSSRLQAVQDRVVGEARYAAYTAKKKSTRVKG